MSSDKAINSATLELTQRIQMHFPRNIPPNILKEWNSCRVDILQQKLFEVFSQGLAEKIEKFSLMLKLKITIPADYQHTGHLNRFYKNNKKKFYLYNDDITDEKFGTVSHQLIPGKTYLVKIWLINKGMIVTSQEILSLLEANHAYLTGVQGTSILWQEKKDELSKGKWYVSFDKKEKLPIANGDTLVPSIYCHSDGDFMFDFGYFEDDWDDNDCVIGFCDCEEPEA